MRPDATFPVRQGASGLMIVALAAMIVSLVVFLMPYQDFPRLFGGRASRWDAVAAGLCATSAGWILLCTAVFEAAQRGHQRRLLARAVRASDEPMPLSAGLRHIYGSRRIDIAILGDPSLVIDQGGAVSDGPWVARGADGASNYVVVLPARALARLRNDPEALDAALAHEAAHVVHGDLRALIGFEEVLRATIVVVPIAVCASVFASSLNDVLAGESVSDSIEASLLGKGSIVVLPALVGLSILLLRFAESFREALADRFAADVIGDAALLRASSLLLDRRDIAREDRLKDETRTFYGPGLVAAYGFAVGAVAGDLPSPIAFFRTLLSAGSQWQAIFGAAFEVVRILIYYGGAFALASLLRQSRGINPLRDSIGFQRLATYAACAIAGELITQALPLACSAAPVFDRLSNISRHDAMALLLSSVAEEVALVCACILTAALLASGNSQRQAERFLVGLHALSVAPLEPVVAPGIAYGFVSAAITTLIAIAAFWLSSCPHFQSRSHLASIGTAVAAGIVVVAPLGIMGPLAPAQAFMALAEAAEHENDLSEAVALLRQSQRFSRLSPAAPLALAKTELSANIKGSVAVEDAEAALTAPYLHDWGEKFDALNTLAAALLDRRMGGDVATAASHLRSARDLWNRDARLDAATGVMVFYNSATVTCLQSGEPLVAIEQLFTAISLSAGLDRTDPSDPEPQEKKFAAMALADPDLERLGLGEKTVPASSTITFFASAGPTTHIAVQRALAAGMSEAEVLLFLKWMIRRIAGL